MHNRSTQLCYLVSDPKTTVTQVESFIIQEKIDINTSSPYDEFPIEAAARKGNAEVFAYLLSKGANAIPEHRYFYNDKNLISEAKNNPLTWGYILDPNNKIWEQLPGLITELQVHVCAGRLLDVKALLEKNPEAFFSISQVSYFTAYDWAFTKDQMHILEFLQAFHVVQLSLAQQKEDYEQIAKLHRLKAFFEYTSMQNIPEAIASMQVAAENLRLSLANTDQIHLHSELAFTLAYLSTFYFEMESKHAIYTELGIEHALLAEHEFNDSIVHNRLGEFHRFLAYKVYQSHSEYIAQQLDTDALTWDTIDTLAVRAINLLNKAKLLLMSIPEDQKIRADEKFIIDCQESITSIEEFKLSQKLRYAEKNDAHKSAVPPSSRANDFKLEKQPTKQKDTEEHREFKAQYQKLQNQLCQANYYLRIDNWDLSWSTLKVLLPDFKAFLETYDNAKIKSLDMSVNRNTLVDQYVQAEYSYKFVAELMGYVECKSERECKAPHNSTAAAIQSALDADYAKPDATPTSAYTSSSSFSIFQPESKSSFGLYPNQTEIDNLQQLHQR